MEQSNVIEEKLQESKPLLVHRHLKTRKQSQESYCPVVTYDGITKNPEYKQRPMRHY
jgi:hypothetical protein